MTGDPANADPVCDLSPHHHLVTEMVERASRPQPAAPAAVVEKPLLFRDRKNSKALIGE
jgi:pyrroloquinoline quinone biosynthesis protein E